MDAIKNYYETHDEENRLTPNHGKVEFITTMKYIHEYLDEKPDSKIIEIGAATGRYSVTLAKEGYDVTAVELVPANLDKLRAKLDGTEKIEAYEGNALDLSQFKDETFDITLVLGPMYHLFSATDLKKALSEAVRITKKGGHIFVAYIMNEPAIIECLFLRGRLDEMRGKGLVSEDWHCLSTPDDLFNIVRTEEIAALNTTVPATRVKLIATDGISEMLGFRINELNEDEFKAWVDFHLNVCERTDVLGMSCHTLDILQKND